MWLVRELSLLLRFMQRIAQVLTSLKIVFTQFGLDHLGLELRVRRCVVPHVEALPKADQSEPRDCRVPEGHGGQGTRL